MAGQNTLILATDYNVIQSKIALVMGTGSGTTGYGQTLASSQVAANTNKVSVLQWNNLRSDIVRARQHQTGNTIGSKAPGDSGYTAGADLPIPTAASQVKESWRAAYLSMATDAETNALTAPPPVGESSRVNLIPNTSRSAVWNTSVQQTITVTWPTANDARYYWNSGGQIEISSDFIPRVAGLKNTTWVTMLQSMGVIKIGITATTTTGSGTAIALGFNNMGAIDNLLFQKDAPAGAYANNKFYILGRVDSTSDRKQLILTVVWDDASIPPVSTPDPGFQVDEQVDGVLTSYVQSNRATGSNVSVPLPSATTSIIS